MKYKVKLNITNKEYICTSSMSMLNGKSVTVYKPKINPTGLEVVETIIAKLGISRIYGHPGKWKKDYIDDVNASNGTAYDYKMPYDEFLKLLDKEGTVIIEYIEEEKKVIEMKEETTGKYVPF